MVSGEWNGAAIFSGFLIPKPGTNLLICTALWIFADKLRQDWVPNSTLKTANVPQNTTLLLIKALDELTKSGNHDMELSIKMAAKNKFRKIFVETGATQGQKTLDELDSIHDVLLEMVNVEKG